MSWTTFNPSLVRLAPQVFYPTAQEAIRLSIPAWFDWRPVARV